jgi:hypothetical protein
MSASVRRLWIQLTADRRKFWILCVCVMAGLLLWARLIIVSQPPRMAIADDAGPSVTDRVGARGRVPGADNAGSRTGHSSTDPKAQRAPIRVELSAIPVQDPFVISPLYFPKPSSFTESTQQAGKSSTEAAEEAEQIEARMTSQIRALADRLKLEAAVGGSMAVIGGRTYRVGDRIQGAPNSPFEFTLAEIRQRSVILECEGRRLELQMASPGT